jgi:phosphatidylserine/phosphatidylglycerophosphate/cardiolipin synthase-like enzyme
MNLQEWEGMLRKTAEDSKLTHAERTALRECLREASIDDHSRGILRGRAFEIAREMVQTAVAPAEALGWLEELNKVLLPPTGDGHELRAEVQFSPGEACQRRICMLFEHCRHAVDVCVFTITDDRITEAMMKAKGRGVAIRVVTDNEKAYDEGSDVRRLAQAGIPVRVDDSPFHMHHKFAIYDGGLVLTGSYNWTLGAARNNQENLIVSNDRRFLQGFKGEFERLWKLFERNPL